MGEVQETDEEVPYAWDRSNNTDGHFLPAMNYTSKSIIDASCCGGFKRRSVEEARQVIEDLAKCNYKTPSESSGSINRMRGNGLIGLDRTTAIETKLDVVMNKLRRMHTAHEVKAVQEEIRSSAEGYEEEELYQVEETKYMNEQRSYHFKPNPNLPTHYSPTLRNHENFSYGGGAQWVLDMDRTTIRLILSLGFNISNNSRSKIGITKESIKGRKELKPLKIRCYNS